MVEDAAHDLDILALRATAEVVDFPGTAVLERREDPATEDVHDRVRLHRGDTYTLVAHFQRGVRAHSRRTISHTMHDPPTMATGTAGAEYRGRLCVAAA